jgi:hypothetical protein
MADTTLHHANGLDHTDFTDLPTDCGTDLPSPWIGCGRRAQSEVSLSTIKRLVARHRRDAEDDRVPRVSLGRPRSIDSG